jgi:predicted transcriptional regulator
MSPKNEMYTISKKLYGVEKVILRDIIEAIDGKLISGEEFLDKEIEVICGADLMSDVLACHIKPKTLLVTSLINAQVMRTADIVDLEAIIFVRGKKPADLVIEMAKDLEIPLIRTDYTMYKSCGILYQLGLQGCN